jgi:hypothetical protein
MAVSHLKVAYTVIYPNEKEEKQESHSKTKKVITNMTPTLVTGGRQNLNVTVGCGCIEDAFFDNIGCSHLIKYQYISVRNVDSLRFELYQLQFASCVKIPLSRYTINQWSETGHSVPLIKVLTLL